MNKIYMIALAIATGLNIFYTVYSYNEMNKWKNVQLEQHQETNQKLDDQLSFMATLIDSNSNMIGNVNSRSNQADSKIAQTMMSLETRLYELEDKLELLQCNPLANECK